MSCEGWSDFRLGDVCTKIGSGATPRGGADVYLAHGPYTLIRSQNIYNDGFHREGLAFIGEGQATELSNVEVRPRDILLNITGDSVARCCQVDDSILPARVNQHVAIVRPDPQKLDARFLRYCLISPSTQAKMLSWAGSGGTRNALTKGMIESFEISAPREVTEQSAIGLVLGTLDDKIQANRQMDETLECIARTLFKSWFVDFDPVHAKVEGRDPGLPKELADLFPDSLENSELGAIPGGWHVGPFLSCAELLSGGTPKTSQEEYWGGQISWASAKDVSQCDGAFLVETERTITEKGLEESATQMIPAFSTVVVARGATTGRMTLLGCEMAMNQTCYALTSLINAPFTLYCQLRHEIDGLVHAAHGSVFDTITTSTFANSKIVLLPGPIVGHFEKRIGPLFRRILVNIQESRALSILRDSLLPKLTSGDLRVKNPEHIVGRNI